MTTHCKQRTVPAALVVLAITLTSSGAGAADQVVDGRLDVRQGLRVEWSASVERDLSVEGNACVGDFCLTNLVGPLPRNELRLRTSRGRIHFDHFSPAVGFQSNSWLLVANDPGIAGARYFALEDAPTTRQVFRIDAGAPSNALRVLANGNVGIGTATPGRHLSIRTGDTPSVRLEQDGSSSYPPQTWEIAANELAYEIRDATVQQNNKIPFRIRPGAPSNSVEIAANGNVGIGTASPSARLHTIGGVRFQSVNGCAAGIRSSATGVLSCIGSSRQIKNLTGDLPSHVAVANVMALRAQTGAYKETPDVPEHWLIAEEVATVDPALVGLDDREPYVVKTQNVVANLVAVVQQQQKRIDELERRLSARQ